MRTLSIVACCLGFLLAPASAAESASYLVAGKSTQEVTAFQLKDAVEKVGWKSEGFTYGGVIGPFEMFGLVAARDGKKVTIGLTRMAKTPGEKSAIAAKHDLKTLYKLAAADKAALLQSAFADKEQAFVWLTDHKGSTAADSKALWDAVVTKAP